jgi:rhodanese-related sulfurtransferase
MRMGRSLPRLVERLRRSFAWIEASELKRRLDHGEAVTVVDVRGRDEFVGPLGHIATARNIPVAELESRLGELAGLEREPVVLVCRTDKRSAIAAQTLRAAGFTQVNVLRRGMESNGTRPAFGWKTRSQRDDQNSPCRRPEKNDIGPRSALSAGFIMN